MVPMRLGRSSASTTSPWLVVGLGNPGDKYHSTRHNIGHMVADELVDRYGGSFRAHKTQNALATLRLGETREKVLVAKPATYMNLSGGPVRALTTFFKVRLDQLIVVHDELDIDFDRLRIKRGGGDGGHNGLKSITQCIGDKNYYRVRAGIGRPPGAMDVSSYVLKPFNSTQRQVLPLHVSTAADAVESLITDGLTPTQNRFH